MNGGRFACQVLVAAALVALGCDGQQYVAPNTVALVIEADDTGAKHVDECLAIPVLLGSRRIFHYTVDPQLGATLDMTRDDLIVSFESTSGVVEPFRVPSRLFEDAAREQDPAPPSGYSVELVSPCLP